ncbi:uncharacterized protein LOC132945407 isoform X1 [Metopolophium dirhodum]|uniref:uncharacterized protein LOC132945407 isoform X1 n=2 Tax=Metopolophium dirhodum TaxID=44670 RepID=UPI002990597F|nr:uncharacterized protein LOC132945407 isoform X1 [Metopolophium dirhodum]
MELMEEPGSRKSVSCDRDGPYYSTLNRPGRSPSTRSTPCRSTSRRSTPGQSTSGRSTSVCSRSTADRSTTPEAPPVPPATYHWEEVRRKRSVGGYPWTHLNKPPFDENTWVKYERDHVYEPVTPAASTDRISPPVMNPLKDENRHFLRIPLTEELVMADDTGSEPESEQQQHQQRRPNREKEDDEDDEDDDNDDDEEDDDGEDDNDDDNGIVNKKNLRSDESIYEGENENSSMGDVESGNTRMKVFQQKVKVKADILRSKLQGVTKRKPKQKIVMDTPNSEKPRRKFGQFATLPKKFTFNAPKVNFSTAFGHFSRRSADPNESSTDETKSVREETKSGRFSLPRFGLSRTSSESPKPSKSVKIGGSRLSIPGFRPRTWSDASKVSKPDSPKPRIMDFGTYPRIFSKRRKTNAANKAKTPPPSSDGGEPESNNYKRKDSFHRRFFRSHKESTPAPTEEQTATLAVEEELDEPPLQVSKESLAEFGDSDLQEVISLSDDCSRSKDAKSLSDHRAGVIEEIDSDEFFLREKGLSRGDVHISNYLSSEIRDVFRSNRTRSVEGVNDNDNGGVARNNRETSSGIATPVRPSRTNSLRRPIRHTVTDANTERSYVADRFSTMPKSFGGTRSLKKPEDDTPENIITSQTFEPSQNPVLPSGVPWRTSGRQTAAATVAHMPPKPPTRQRMSKFSTFDTRSMIDLSRKRSQSQIGFQPSMNFSETVPKAPMRRSRTSLAGSDHDISSAVADYGGRPSWAVNGSGAGVPTPPLRRSRMSLSVDADVEERSATAAYAVNGSASARSTGSTPPRPPPPRTTTTTSSAVAGYATVDKSSQSTATLLLPPQSPMRHRRKKSYDVIKSQEFGAFFTIPRSYSYCDRNARPSTTADTNSAAKLPPPSRPARAYNTLGPSRPLRRRLPVSEHEYGDVADDGSGRHRHDDDDGDDRNDGTAKAAAALCSGDVIEKMKLRPLPSPPPPPRKSRAADDMATPEPQRRRNTDSALVPFLDRRETSATSSNDFFADVSRALLASAAKNAVAICADDVSVAVQTDPSPAADDYLSDDHRDDGSCCSADSYDRPSKSTAAAAAATPRHLAPKTLTTAGSTTDRPRTRSSSQITEYVDRPTSGMSVTAADDCSCNGYAMVSDAAAAGGVTAVRAQCITVEELQVGRMIVADILGQRMAVDDMSGSSLKIAQFAAAAQHPSLQQDATAAVQASPACADDPMTTHVPQLQDDAASVQSSRVSSMYPEVDSDEDRASVLAAPTPPRRRSKPPSSPRSPATADHHDQGKNGCRPSGTVGAVDLSTADPSITELSCQLFRLCHSNVCSLFTKVVQQVVPEDTEKRRDLQAALCFLSIILAGLLILGFGNEKTIHHHHWDFQFPPNQ